MTDLNKFIKATMTIDVIYEVPEEWDENMINFYFNESSWCADNMLDLLIERSQNGKCSCDITEFSYVKDVSPEEAEKWGYPRNKKG